VKRAAGLLPPVLALAAVVILCATHADQLGQALDNVEPWVFVLAAAIHVMVLIVRTEAWRLTLAATGRKPELRAAHWASAIGFAAGIVEGHAALPARMATARKVAPDSTPPLTAMVLSDVPVYALELCLIIALVPLAATAEADVPTWALVALAVLPPLTVLGLRLVYQRFESHRLAAGLAVLAQPSRRGPLLALAAGIVALTFVRVWVTLWAVGLPAGPGHAALAYIAVTIVGQLPLGPAVGPAATLAVASGSGVAKATAAGLVISATSVAAVLVYLAVTSVMRPGRSVRERWADDGGAERGERAGQLGQHLRVADEAGD
jgi:hypothetical protein